MHVRHLVHGVITIGALWATAPAAAHHAGGVQYDPAKPITLTGTVTTIEWQHPHQGFSLDVKDVTGRVTSWEFVLEGPNNPIRRGWTRTSLKVGDTVSVRGFRARDGSPLASAVAVTMSDGRSVVDGSSRKPSS